jgi:hypothetical protein
VLEALECIREDHPGIYADWASQNTIIVEFGVSEVTWFSIDEAGPVQCWLEDVYCVLGWDHHTSQFLLDNCETATPQLAMSLWIMTHNKLAGKFHAITRDAGAVIVTGQSTINPIMG